MKRRKKRRNWPLTLILYSLVLCCAVYLAVLPALDFWRDIQAAGDLAIRHARWSLADTMRTRLFELLIYGWVFMFGASIGSFLNVVIYRVPRRMSLLGGSKCPFCRVAIHGYDNIPVFAWISLRGRCRSCRLPISVRYPLVELAVGLLFLLLAALEVFQAGVNLPIETVARPTTLGWFVGRPDWGLLAICAYHCFLLSVLFSWAWIQADRRDIPLSYLLLAITVGIVGAALWPDVHPVAWSAGLPGGLAEFGWTVRLDDSFVGFVFGTAIGFAMAGVDATLRSIRRFPRPPVQETILMHTLVGVCLGWQASASVAAISLTAGLLAAVGRKSLRIKRRPVPAAVLFLAALMQVVMWRLLVQRMGWPFPGIEV